MKHALLTLVFALLCSLASFSQVDLRVGPGIGYGVFAPPPPIDDFSQPHAGSETHYNVGHSAIAGVNCRWLFGKHWVLQHGLDYQFSTQHSYGSTISSSLQSYAQATQYESNWRAHHILMPISGGFAFGGGKVRHSFLLGIRLGYLVSNFQYTHTEYTMWTYPSPRPGPIDTKKNLLDSDATNRLLKQLQLTYEIEIGKGLFVNLNIAMGKPRTNLRSTDSYFALHNSMVYFGVGYRPLGHLFHRPA